VTAGVHAEPSRDKPRQGLSRLRAAIIMCFYAKK
jgi:hypothetical protein